MADEPYEGEAKLQGIASMRTLVKTKGFEIVYIRHNGKPGGALERRSEGWETVSELTPDKDDAVFDKNFNSAFLHTGLDDYLRSINVERMIGTGMQTEFCIDATVKSAFERGYEIILPRGARTTFDNDVLTGE